ncbi:MAG: hypothetical protein H7175_23065 [Burkholderiales bacterium]|nr:hypothetical protein [Anaerolineae bacterium]
MSDGCNEIFVVIDHPHGRIDVPLATWIEKGPGPRRYVKPVGAKCSDDRALPFRVIPLRYRNSTISRLLIRLKLLTNPWE